MLESNCLRPTGLKNSSNTIKQENGNRMQTKLIRKDFAYLRSHWHSKTLENSCPRSHWHSKRSNASVLGATGTQKLENWQSQAADLGVTGIRAQLSSELLAVENRCLRSHRWKNNIRNHNSKLPSMLLQPNPLASNLQSSAHVYVRDHASIYIYIYIYTRVNLCI